MKLASLRRQPAVELFAQVAPAQLVGTLGSVFAVIDAGLWYTTLTCPWFAPPNWVLGPVWMVLFTLMGVATWPASQRDHPRHERALAVLVGHLVVNVAWSAALFGLQLPAIGLAAIVVLLTAILVTAREFAAVNRRAAALLVPCPLRTCFAAVFNYGFWPLNRGVR